MENQLLLLVMQIPIHSCPWFAITCSPLAASPTPRHPTDQVTYLHRRHQQRQLFRLTQLLRKHIIVPFIYTVYLQTYCQCRNLRGNGNHYIDRKAWQSGPAEQISRCATAGQLPRCATAGRVRKILRKTKIQQQKAASREKSWHLSDMNYIKYSALTQKGKNPVTFSQLFICTSTAPGKQGDLKK